MIGVGQVIHGEIAGILDQPWNPRTGTVVPTTETVVLNGGRVDLVATMLYADLADSTLIAIANREAAARLFRAYLALAARLITARGGEIRSFDGDRIMAVFMGPASVTDATSAGMEIAWAFRNLLAPLFSARYPMFVTGGYRLNQAVGIDFGEVSVVRGGIRNHNDLVWIGRAPNIAAKLSNLRDGFYAVYLTEEAFQFVPDHLRFVQPGPQLIWELSTAPSVPVARFWRTTWWLPLL